MARREKAAHCIVYQCQGKPYARDLCTLHYERWRRGERLNLETGKRLERDLAERAIENADRAARRTEEHTARLAGCPLEQALAAGLGLRERNVL